MTTFFRSGNTRCSLYTAIRDGTPPPTIAARGFVEQLWAEGHPYVDGRFRDRARDDLLPCFWELYIAAYLNRLSEPLIPWHARRCKDDGPDLQVGQVQYWIEATAPSSGSGPDAIPPVSYGRMQPVPGEAIILRIRSALAEKLRKLRTYLRKGTVRPGEPFLLAINGRALRFGNTSGSLPWVVSAVFPLGEESITINTQTGQVVRRCFEKRLAIEKASGATVTTNCFLDPAFAGISGILFSNANPDNPHPELGFDFTIVHNPLATAPFARGKLTCWEEYWSDGDYLHVERQER